ncbi:MAG: DUF4416 family protein [Thermodesulfobacteriota bacterium]
MGAAPERMRLVVSLLAAAEPPRALAVRRLAGDLGPLDYLSRPLIFDYSDYYAAEMGGPLTRRLATFRRMVGPLDLAGVKARCLALEAELALEGRRRVNLDPGLLSADALILATTKYRGHRLPLAQGLWQELTLWFNHGRYHPLPWTYPDYAGPQLREMMAGLRRRLLWQLKAAGGPEEGGES